MAGHQCDNEDSESEHGATRMHNTIAGFRVLLEIKGEELVVAGELRIFHRIVVDGQPNGLRLPAVNSQ